MGWSEDVYGLMYSGLQAIGMNSLWGQAYLISTEQLNPAYASAFLHDLEHRIAHSKELCISEKELARLIDVKDRAMNFGKYSPHKVAQPVSLTNDNLNKPPRRPVSYDGRTKNSA